MDDTIELTVLTPEITGVICSDHCGSKCCNFRVSKHYVPIEIVDYANLARLGLTNFVSFNRSVELPQLLAKPSGDCVFLNPEDRLCMIYEYRPFACRAYPYPEEDEEEVDLPPWCELFHRSSTSLIEERMELTKEMRERYYNVQSDVDYDVLMEYLQLEKSTKHYNLPTFVKDEVITSELNFWHIQAINNDSFSSVKGLSDKLQKDDIIDLLLEYNPLKRLNDEDWKLFALIFYDENLNIIGTLSGITRKNEEVDVPHIVDFPPDIENYERLLGITISSDDYNKNIYRGAIIPEKMKEILELRKSDSKFIDLESQ